MICLRCNTHPANNKGYCGGCATCSTCKLRPATAVSVDCRECDSGHLYKNVSLAFRSSAKGPSVLRSGKSSEMYPLQKVRVQAVLRQVRGVGLPERRTRNDDTDGTTPLPARGGRTQHSRHRWRPSRLQPLRGASGQTQIRVRLPMHGVRHQLLFQQHRYAGRQRQWRFAAWALTKKEKDMTMYFSLIWCLCRRRMRQGTTVAWCKSCAVVIDRNSGKEVL